MFAKFSSFLRSCSYYNRNVFELIKLLEIQQILNWCGIYFCTEICFFQIRFLSFQRIPDIFLSNFLKYSINVTKERSPNNSSIRERSMETIFQFIYEYNLSAYRHHEDRYYCHTEIFDSKPGLPGNAGLHLPQNSSWVI